MDVENPYVPTTAFDSEEPDVERPGVVLNCFIAFLAIVVGVIAFVLTFGVLSRIFRAVLGSVLAYAEIVVFVLSSLVGLVAVLSARTLILGMARTPIGDDEFFGRSESLEGFDRGAGIDDTGSEALFAVSQMSEFVEASASAALQLTVIMHVDVVN